MDNNSFIDINKLQEWIKRYKCIDRYEWYKRDLRRKRPNRKRGRDLYHGIQAYRRRVGQREDRLCFRGVADMYDMLRIKVICRHPELAEEIPDLYMRFFGLRFSPREFEAQVLARPKPIVEIMRKSVIPQFYHDIGSIRVKLPPMMVSELTRTLDGSDAVLARVKETEPDDVAISFAMAMLKDEDNK